MQFESTPFVCLLVGKPKSGKSHLIKQILIQGFKSGYWKFGHIFSQTNKFNEDYNFFPSHRVSKYSKQAFENYIDFVERRSTEYKERGIQVPPNVLVVDDCIGRVNFWSETWANLIGTRRHYNMSIIIVSQSLYAGGYGSSTLLRDSLNYAFVWNCNNKSSIKGYFESFGNRVFDKLDEFKALFSEAVKEKHRCLAFRNSENENEMFSFFKAQKEIEDVNIEGF